MVLFERSISESEDDIDIRPLELEDIRRPGLTSDGESESDRDEVDHHQLSSGDNRFFSAVYGIGLKHKQGTNDRKTVVKMTWKNAIMKAMNMGDPWKKFHLDDYKTEKARRHRYNALRQCWKVDEVFVKMETTSFNHGAMRQCYRMKKLSNFAKCNDWSRAHNYVAKSYIDERTPRNVYYEDVRLQMDAKLWGEEYNRHNPPKKVDIFQMAVLELYERDGCPLFHLEHFIEGKYVKYNSNSGFVRSEALRMTPQAFSHFTFERSGHELIVVDVQGVGDLYTDPQIHTAAGTDYGDGNLGTHGMALFLHSHICNSICRSLNLTEFDLAPSEVEANKRLNQNMSFAKTMVRGTEEIVVIPSEMEREDIQKCIRLRSISSGYLSESDMPKMRLNSTGSFESIEGYDDMLHKSENEDSGISSACRKREERFHSVSESSEIEANSVSRDQEHLQQFNEMVQKMSRPSHVMGEIEHLELLKTLQQEVEEPNKLMPSRNSVLGEIHLNLAKYHELNRFVEESETYDKEAALFHVIAAAHCGLLEATLTMARLHLGLPHDILPDLEMPDNQVKPSVGFDYLCSAAASGDRWSMIQVAKAFDTGCGLPCDRNQNWSQAVEWMEKAVNKVTVDSDGAYDGTMYDPNYLLVSRQAAMYLAGGFGLAKDPNKAGELYSYAGELATEAMKGKLASQYYMLAEQAWESCEEEQ